MSDTDNQSEDATPSDAASAPEPAAPPAATAPAEPPADARRAALRFGRLALIVLTLLLAGKGIHSLVPQDEAPPALGDVPHPTVRTLTLQREQVRQQVERYGRLLPARQWSLTTEVPGRVTERPVDNGARVSDRALLVALDPAPFEAERAAAAAVISQSEASLALAETRLKRLERLRTSTTTKDALDQAAAARKRAEAGLTAARARHRKASYQLDHCRLLAPAPGVVSQLGVEVGDYVVPGQRLGRFSQVDTLLVKLLVSGEVRRGVAVGQAATVIDAREREHAAKLVRAAPVPLGETGQFELEIAVDNRARALLAGEPVRCRFQYGERKPRLRVPRASVYEEYGLWRALIPPGPDAPGIARSVAVKLGSGEPAEGWVEVHTGLKQGDVVLVPERVAAIREGQRIEVATGRPGSGWWPTYAAESGK